MTKRRLTLLLLALAGLFAAWPRASVAAETRPITFPVEGKVTYRDDFGEPRSGHTHQGNDIFGAKLQKLLAAHDGRITWTSTDSSGTSGNMLILEDSEGWDYWYIHINNDSPGTDDGANPSQWILAPGIGTGSVVKAGQHLAYLGDSGNAEGTTPHLHFEIRRPDGVPINPYPSLQAAQQGTVPVVGAGSDVAANPQGGYYVLKKDGSVQPFGGAPHFGHPGPFSPPIANSLAVMPDGAGYAVLDGYGGVHLFGSARTGLGGLIGPYWQGWDIARSVVITSTGRGFAVLDGWGGVHRAGDMPATGSGAYWPNQDVARDLALTRNNLGTFVLHASGSVHVTGNAVFKGNAVPSIANSARSIATKWRDGYAVLDGSGKIHTFGAELPPGSLGTTTKTDRWRGLSLLSRRYVAVRDDLLVEKR